MFNGDGDSFGVDGDISFHTAMKNIKFRAKWTIENKCIRKKTVNQCFTSPTFMGDNNGSTQRRLEFYPCGIKEQTTTPSIDTYAPATGKYGDTSRSASSYNQTLPPSRSQQPHSITNTVTTSIPNALVEIKLIYCKQTSVETSCELFFVNKDFRVKKSLNMKKIFRVNEVVRLDTLVKIDDLLKKENGFLANSELTMYCDFLMADVLITESHQAKSVRYRDLKVNSLISFETLVGNRDFSDVTIVVEGREIPAHKNILAVRSPVFNAMFKTEMKENMENRVEISDLSYDSVFEMMRYIYTGTIAKNLMGVARDLFLAADKYDLQELKTICEDAIALNITADTASEILMMAHLHNGSCLKQKVIDFIDNHCDDVKITEGWKVMTQKHPDLVIETFVFKKSKK